MDLKKELESIFKQAHSKIYCSNIEPPKKSRLLDYFSITEVPMNNDAFKLSPLLEEPIKVKVNSVQLCRVYRGVIGFTEVTKLCEELEQVEQFLKTLYTEAMDDLPAGVFFESDDIYPTAELPGSGYFLRHLEDRAGFEIRICTRYHVKIY